MKPATTIATTTTTEKGVAGAAAVGAAPGEATDPQQAAAAATAGAAWGEQKRRVRVEGYELAFVERGRGPTVVFLHGNPTSSYLWRAMIAELAGRYRCLAPDLIGMGDSEKLREGGPEAYGYEVQQRFVDGWFEAVLPALGAEPPEGPEGPDGRAGRAGRAARGGGEDGDGVVLVVHDWGAALGLDWARRHARRVRGVAYMEGVIAAIPWAGMPPQGRSYFEALRGPAGEQMVLEDNAFVEGMLAPGGFLRPPSQADAAEYRRPFTARGEGRRPTLSWPRMLPFDGEPRAIAERLERSVAWFAAAEMPKLFIDADPGRVLVGALRERCLGFANQTRVRVPGMHYPQEDSPREVTAALAGWLAEVVAVRGERAEQTP